jgi:hypothetical protein
MSRRDCDSSIDDRIDRSLDSAFLGGEGRGSKCRVHVDNEDWASVDVGTHSDDSVGEAGLLPVIGSQEATLELEDGGSGSIEPRSGVTVEGLDVDDDRAFAMMDKGARILNI